MSTTADTSLTDAVQIRPATADDAASVFELLKQLGTEYAPDRAAFDAAFDHAVDDSASTLMLVAEQTPDGVVGYAFATIAHLLHTNGSSAQLQELVVDRSVKNVVCGSSRFPAAVPQTSLSGLATCRPQISSKGYLIKTDWPPRTDLSQAIPRCVCVLETFSAYFVTSTSS